MAADKDNRLAPRAPISVKVNLEFEKFSGFISEYSMNISQGGIFIKTDEPKPVGTVLSFEFRLSDNFKLIQGLGEVTWVRRRDGNPENPKGMGIRFHDIDAKSRELIRTMVDRYISEGGTPFQIDIPPPDAETGNSDNVQKEFSAIFTNTEKTEKVETHPPPKSPILLEAEAEAETLTQNEAGEGLGFSIDSETSSSLPMDAPPISDQLEGEKPGFRKENVPSKKPLLMTLFIVAILFGGGVYVYLFTNVFQKFTKLKPLLAVVTKKPTPEPVPTTPPQATPIPVSTPAATPAPTPAPIATPSPVPTLVPTVPPTPVPTAIPKPAPTVIPKPETTPQASEPKPAISKGIHLEKLVSVTWTQNKYRTLVTLTSDGPFTEKNFDTASVGGNAPREVVIIRGVKFKFSKSQITINNQHLQQIRFGFHTSKSGNELHAVFDLSSPNVRLGEVIPKGNKLIVEFQNRN